MRCLARNRYILASGFSIRCERRQISSVTRSRRPDKTATVTMRQDMNNTNQRRSTPMLAAIAILGVSIFSTTAQACLYYKDTVGATNLWGLPEENTSAVQAVVPAKSRVCIDEELPGPNGQKWARISFYVTDEIRYSARGWVNVERFAKTTQAEQPASKKTPSVALPAPIETSPASSSHDKMLKSNPDDDAMIDTLQAQRRELDMLKDQNTQLKKRLSGLPKMAPKMSGDKMNGEMKRHEAEKIQPMLPADPVFLKQRWRLNPSKSKLSVESVFDGSLVETHRFTKLSGKISSSGEARITIALDAFKTGNKMRDIRVSHLLFQSDKYPTATISAMLDKSLLAPLNEKGHQLFDLKLKLKLHGTQKDFETRVKLTRMKDGRLNVASLNPIMISAADFALRKGIAKLITIAGGKSIIPVIPVRFNFTFDAKS